MAETSGLTVRPHLHVLEYNLLTDLWSCPCGSLVVVNEGMPDG